MLETPYKATRGREHLGRIGGQEPPSAQAVSPRVLSRPPTPKCHPQILHPTLLLEKEKQGELRSGRERGLGEGVLFYF